MKIEYFEKPLTFQKKQRLHIAVLERKVHNSLPLGGEVSFKHSIAFASREDLHGRVVDCSQEGFLLAMDVSCHSFIRVARLAEPLMKNGGSLFTMSFYGAEKVVEHYNLMGDITFWDDFSFHIASGKAD